ncbi:MAG: hypothetical protein MUF49_01640 [Oculatellaceae cyanobacterium Prado106]|nr:hypothetical protein [Oculatellaceae cyanobacterium Prado106]
MQQQPKKQNWLWPEINDLPSAQSAAMQGTSMCIVIVVFSWIIALIVTAMGVTPNFQLLIGASLLYGLIAFLIAKMSRLAAIAGLILYLVDRVAFISQNGSNGASAGIMVVFIIAFISSIRGTFAYHQIRRDRQTEIAQPEGQSD